MEFSSRRGVTIPTVAFLGLILAVIVGWMSAIFLFGKTNEDGSSLKLVSELAMEAAKAALIGTAAALAVDRYLKIAVGPTPESDLKASGIKRIYTNRGMAASDLIT